MEIKCDCLDIEASTLLQEVLVIAEAELLGNLNSQIRLTPKIGTMPPLPYWEYQAKENGIPLEVARKQLNFLEKELTRVQDLGTRISKIPLCEALSASKRSGKP